MSNHINMLIRWLKLLDDIHPTSDDSTQVAIAYHIESEIHCKLMVELILDNRPAYSLKVVGSLM